jgi:hypothetical protein
MFVCLLVYNVLSCWYHTIQWNIIGICQEYAWNEPGMCLECTWNTPGMGLEYAWNGPGMDLEWAWNGPGIHLEWTWNGPGINPRIGFKKHFFLLGLYSDSTWNDLE